jgi:hypothetical protein
MVANEHMTKNSLSSLPEFTVSPPRRHHHESLNLAWEINLNVEVTIFAICMACMFFLTKFTISVFRPHCVLMSRMIFRLSKEISLNGINLLANVMEVR